MASRQATIQNLGPFVGGINNRSEVSALADNELLDCVNYDIQIDGSLQSRPPLEQIHVSAGVVGDDWLSVKTIGTGRLNGDPYVFFCVERDDGVWGTRAYNYRTKALWSIPEATLRSSAAIQIGNLIFFVAQPASPTNGGYWNGAAWTTDATMPRGEAALFFKQRLWICPGKKHTTDANRYQLRFTEPISVAVPTPLNWNAGVNVIPVGQGDGDYLIDLAVVNDTIMLFKQNSTWVFTYDAAPAEGLLRIVNTAVGVNDKHCMVQYENSTYVLHKDKVYEITNYVWQDLTIRCQLQPADIDSSGLDAYSSLSLISDRVVARIDKEQFVFHTKVKAWTRWVSEMPGAAALGRGLEVPYDTDVTDNTDRVYAFGYEEPVFLPRHNAFFQMVDTPFPVAKESYRDAAAAVVELPFVCFIRTKGYVFDSPVHYKKLLWWAADVEGASDVEGNLIIFSKLPFLTPWSNLFGSTWLSLGTETWGSLSLQNINIPMLHESEGYKARRTLKFKKTVRFKRIIFELSTTTLGDLETGPVRFYTFISIVAIKQVVEKGSN